MQGVCRGYARGMQGASHLAGRRKPPVNHLPATLTPRFLRRQSDFGSLVTRAEEGAIGDVQLLEHGATEGQGLTGGRIKERALERARGRREAQLELLAWGHDLAARANRDRIGDSRGESTTVEGQACGRQIQDGVGAAVSGTKGVALAGEAAQVMLRLAARYDFCKKLNRL